jgi:hypothetical protein
MAKLLTLLDRVNLLELFGMRLEIADSAIGYSERDPATGRLIQHPPEVLKASQGQQKKVRLDKLINLMAEIDYESMERDGRITKITRQYQRRILFFRGKRTKVDYVEYPDPDIVYGRNGD